MKKCILFAIIIVSSLFGTDNSLFIPLNMKQAYQNGTRSYEGSPGAAYWQNHSDYKIKARVYPDIYLVKGEERVIYYNDSPDSLHRIVLRLYQNIYIEGGARDRSIDPGSLHSGVDLYDFKVNDQSIDLDDKGGPARLSETIMRINLDAPLPPGSSVNILCKWKFTLPQKSWVRMGAYSDSSLFVAYWYPQVAVYDDIDGWDYTTYTGTQEFYNDMSDYEVEITAPGSFLVWATGLLKNAGDVLREPFLSRYQEAFHSDSVIRIIRPDDIGADSILVSQNLNTWHYKAENVPDFAFTVCRNHRWDAVSAVVGNPKWDRIIVQAVYPSTSPDFHQVAQIGKSILEYLSTEMPGIPYPYPSMTAFNRPGRGGGMEFPMMVNNGSHTEKGRTVGLTGHEFIHSYFPFYMGINEEKYAWMDEGWAVALNYDPVRSIVSDDEGFVRTILTYVAMAGKEYDLPMMIPSTMLKGPTYRNASYNRSAVAYQLLRDYLGDDKFRQAIRNYVSRWHHKHPIPYDFFFTFNKTVGEDLSWFWNPWFFQRGYPDLVIGSVETDSITVDNSGLLPVPVKLSLTYEDGSEEVMNQPMSIWKDGKKSVNFPLNTAKKLVQASLDTEHIPDVNKSDNTYRVPND